MAGKNVLVILGSPRKNGNSEILAKELISGAEAGGAKVTTFGLQEMNVNPCTACGGCQKRGASGCVVNDDMQKIYPKIKEADVIVIASPIYWFSVTAQTKAFIDRFYALQGKRTGAVLGKKIGILLTYGDSDVKTSGAENAIKMFKDIFNYLGAEIAGVVQASAWKAGDIKSNPKALKEAYELGRKLAS